MTMTVVDLNTLFFADGNSHITVATKSDIFSSIRSGFIIKSAEYDHMTDSYLFFDKDKSLKLIIPSSEILFIREDTLNRGDMR